MSKFLLDTDAVSSASEKVSSLKNEINDVITSVSSYDVFDAAEFNFKKAVDAIKSNLEGCSEKVGNTVTFLNTVLETHTNIQQNQKFESNKFKESFEYNNIEKLQNDALAQLNVSDVKVSEKANLLKSNNDVSSSTEKKVIENDFRITSYYPGESGVGRKTGSGLSTSDFDIIKIGNKSVYSFQGKVVVAAATEELLKVAQNGGIKLSRNGKERQEGKHYFRYNDTLTINIDGQNYDAIVLDSCGASMWEGEKRIDIFVPSASNVVDRYDTTISYEKM